MANRMETVFGWFGPPALSRPDLRYDARALWIVSWPFFAAVTVMLGMAVLVEPQTLERRMITISAVGALTFVLHTISRAGRPQLASWILVIGLSLIVTQRAWITGGIHAPVPIFYALFIVIAGELIGVRGALTTAAVCLAGAVVLAAGTALDWLASPPGAGSPAEAFVFVLLSISLTLVVEALVIFQLHDRRSRPDAVRMLVHDMRSPIQILLGHLDLLRENVAGENMQDVEAAIVGATALQQMTNRILDVGRLESGRMPVHLSATDLSALTGSVLAAARILQPARDIALEAEDGCICNCDPDLTRRIIENLVSNAVKHTAIQGRVRVVVSASAEKAYIAVHDEGPGIPLGRRTRIFEPYSAERLRSAGGYDSSGLGLAFCRLAVEAQGGAIRVEDAAPRGSVFIVELPR